MSVYVVYSLPQDGEGAERPAWVRPLFASRSPSDLLPLWQVNNQGDPVAFGALIDVWRPWRAALLDWPFAPVDLRGVGFPGAAGAEGAVHDSAYPAVAFLGRCLAESRLPGVNLVISATFYDPRTPRPAECFTRPRLCWPRDVGPKVRAVRDLQARAGGAWAMIVGAHDAHLGGADLDLPPPGKPFYFSEGDPRSFLNGVVPCAKLADVWDLLRTRRLAVL
jgi:hypothetical protein